MFGIGTTELLILAAILMLLFGATRLPSMMRNMGRSVNEFKQGLRDEPVDLKNLEDQEEANQAN
ncbi:MAG: twin-arginine translocase TatA/TatE family subunit [Pirellulaceae bacterium]